MAQFEESPTDDRNVFIIQATGFVKMQLYEISYTTLSVITLLAYYASVATN